MKALRLSPLAIILFCSLLQLYLTQIILNPFSYLNSSITNSLPVIPACKPFYVLTSNSTCTFVSPLCQQFNAVMGICQRCLNNLSLVNNTCLQTQNKTLNYQSLNSNQNACFGRQFFNISTQKCELVTPNCRNWNNDGCLACYNGFILTNQKCILNSLIKMANCQQSVCQICPQKCYLANDSTCVNVTKYCNTWDPFTGACDICFPGFYLNQKGLCKLRISPLSIYCKIWSWELYLCKSCLDNYILNDNGICVPAADFCNQTDEQGQCTGCLCGYRVFQGICVVDIENNLNLGNLGCVAYEWVSGQCLQCHQKYYMDNKGWCKMASTNCKTHSSLTGKCTTCFKGYTLTGGKCINLNQDVEKGCLIWSYEYNMCIFCDLFWVFSEAIYKCVPVSGICLEFSSTHDACIRCGNGYANRNGVCIVDNISEIQSFLFGCKEVNGTLCLNCSDRHYMDLSGYCLPMDQFCILVDIFGNCQACFKGYTFSQGRCMTLSNSSNFDPGCAQWDWSLMSCLNCSYRYVLTESAENQSSYCVKISDFCATWNDVTAYCTSCYRGYFVVDGACKLVLQTNCKTWNRKGSCSSCYDGYMLSASKCVAYNDVNCLAWDNTLHKCARCISRFVLSSTQKCVKVNDLCKTWSNEGKCTSCYQGYRLDNGFCNVQVSNDPYCILYNSEGGCQGCSYRYFVNSSNKCSPVSDFCSTWNSTRGQCLSCYTGYVLRSGVCHPITAIISQAFSSPFCSSVDPLTYYCKSCYTGYYLSQGQCLIANPSCKTISDNGKCTSCYGGYAMVEGGCVVKSWP